MSDKYHNLKVGVLALQGDFERHLYQLDLAGAMPSEVRRARDLEGLDGLIVPGGESTTMSMLLDRFSFRKELTAFCRKRGVWGTCAGMIMLASEVVNETRVKPLGIMDISVVRNYYGRQVHSFFADITAALNGTPSVLKASFIRAPKAVRIGDGIESLAEYNDDKILLARGNCLVSSFHTELENDISLTEFFLDHFVMKYRG